MTIVGPNDRLVLSDLRRCVFVGVAIALGIGSAETQFTAAPINS